MDVPSLVAVLKRAISQNPGDIKAAEIILSQVQSTPQHIVRLLQIVFDGSNDAEVRHAASINFKNFITKNWSPYDLGEHPNILPADKEMVRQNILGCLTQVPQLSRVQLGVSLKTIIDSDYPEQWPTLLSWVKQTLQMQMQMQMQQVYGALFVLRVLSRKYEFKSDEERAPMHRIVEETFPHLLNIFNELVQIGDPNIDVAELIRLICKIFWSCIYLEIPQQLYDPNTFNAWMVLFLNMLERPVPLEGQPSDPELRNSWGWWKVKKWTVHILYRLYTRFGDLKLQNPDNKAFAQMFQNYAGKILQCNLNLLNVIRTGGYLPDRVANLILQYLASSLSKSNMYNLLQPQMNVLLFEIVFPLMCFNNNDQILWNEDPHEYVRKGYDIIEDLYNPKTAAMDFVTELVRKRGKDNLQKFVFFIVEIFNRYDASAPEQKNFRQKDGALLAIGILCDKLKQTEPYKSELERMLLQHVFPEFSSPVGHLRAKAAWVAGQYARIEFSDRNTFVKALHCVVAGMRDPELPVRVDSVFALRSFIDACGDLNIIRPILPQLLDEFFKLMNEVENEDLVSTLETIVDKFGEEMAPYALGLCQNLAAAFWKCINTAEADEDVDDPGALAAVGCLRAISTILESVSRLPHLFEQIEPTLFPIMRRMLTTDGQDVYEEVLEIVSYMTFYSPKISMNMWSLWPLMMEALAEWAIDYFPNILVPLDNFISRSTDHFLSCKEQDYQLSLWTMISKVMKEANFEDADIESAPKLIAVLFQNCKGQVDQWLEPYISLSIERLKRSDTPSLKCLLIEVIADALYYNPSLTLSILHKLNHATYIFTLWFDMLKETKKSGARANFKREHEKKICCLGLTSLLILPADQMPVAALEGIFKAILDLLVAYKEQLAEAAKAEEIEDVDAINGFQSDDDDGSDREMADDDEEDGDGADSLKLQKLAAQAKAFHSHHEEEDSSDDDDFSDDEDLQSPIDEVDPFVFFVDSVKVLQASDPLRFQSVTQTFDFHYQALANGIAQHAEQRRVEIEKEKLEKASANAS